MCLSFKYGAVMGDFYQCVVTRPTVGLHDVRGLASELSKDEGVRKLLDELVYDILKGVLANRGVCFDMPDIASYDEEDEVRDRLYEAIDCEAVQGFIRERSKLQPYFATDDRDERNKAVVREHVARAKELVKDIKRIS